LAKIFNTRQPFTNLGVAIVNFSIVVIKSDVSLRIIVVIYLVENLMAGKDSDIMHPDKII
jgi:hypothetical protein